VETSVGGEAVRAFMPPPLPPDRPLQRSPYVTVTLLIEHTGLTAPTLNAVLADLRRLGISEEVTGRRRGRVFGNKAYLAIPSEGTERLPA